MNADRIKKANNPQLLRKAITHHMHKSDRACDAGDFEQSRRHGYLVDSLRDQLRNAGVLDRTQSSLAVGLLNRAGWEKQSHFDQSSSIGVASIVERLSTKQKGLK